MRVNVHVCFAGNCAEAFAHYETLLGGTLVACLRYGEAPASCPTPEGFADKVMHACLDLGGISLMGCDAPPERFQRAAGFSVQLMPETVAESERIFAALAEGGAISMPLQPTFWSPAFGVVTDRIGTPWMVNAASAPAVADIEQAA